MTARPLSTYGRIAAEYYDTNLHPTCSNFREASSRIVRRWLRRYVPGGLWRVEVGVGRSLLAESLPTHEQTLLIDSSRRMLHYSEGWLSHGAAALVGLAEQTPVRSGCCELLVASLGDPYNTSQFWAEVHRILVPGGVCLYTTPAEEWASTFRGDEDEALRATAEFLLSDSTWVRVPSLVYSPPVQSALVSQVGLEVKEIASVRVSEIQGSVSPKLDLGMPDLDCVTGYFVVRPGCQ